MEKLNDILSDLSYAKIVEISHSLTNREICVRGIKETDGKIFLLVFSEVRSVLSLQKYAFDPNIENLAEDIGVYDEFEANAQTKHLKAENISQLKIKFFISTIFYTLYFDAENVFLDDKEI